MMFLRSLVVGLLATNCYILADEDSNQAAVIDPGGGYQDIIKILEERGLTLRYIILTHNHPDHTAVVQRLKEIKGSEILMHRADEGLARMMPSFFDSEDYPIDGVLEDGDEISLGHLTLRVIHTPGHTPGSICLLLDTVLFSPRWIMGGFEALA
jgi:hydroxyacylglutathione hydrolase